MNNDALACFPVHETKRAAVRKALRELDGVNVLFWRYLEGKPQELLHKQLLHLGALREEVLTSADTLLEADAEIVTCKARANKALLEALSPTADLEPETSGESHQSTNLLLPANICLLEALKLNTTEVDALAWTRMSRDWKMLLYSVRCVQDCVYGALLIMQGEQAGGYASMATCLKVDKKGNPKPNALMLERRVPGYCDWFKKMKRIRDEIKRGLVVQSDWTANEHTILLSEPYPDGIFVGCKNVRRLSLDFAAECLCICAAIINAVHAELAEISRLAPTDSIPNN